MPEPKKPLSLPLLTAVVIGSMLASGMFTLPASFARATGPLGLLIAWIIAAVGMLMLALVFQSLAQRRPDLNAGVFAYAKAGFGPYPGFLSALGYWAGICLLNVTYFVLIKATLGGIFPGFGDGNTVQAVAVSSLILWTVHAVILRGVKEAAVINAVVTAAKIIPIAMAAVILGIGFQREVFVGNFWGGGLYEWRDVPGQVRSAMLITVYAFIGIEGASVFSRYAKRREDVGRATLLGLASVASLFFLVTLLSYGVLLRPDLAALRQPSLAGVLETVVGRWGAWMIGVGIIVSVAGAFLARSLLAAEVVWSASRAETMPAGFARENAKRVPAAALWLSSACVQGFLILTLFAEEAYTLSFKLTSAMLLVPYLLVAGFALKLAWRGETYGDAPAARRRELSQAGLATAFAAFLIWAAGLNYLLGAALIYAAGSILFILARREQARPAFTTREAVLFLVIVAFAAAAIYAFAIGAIRS
ncbi:MAG: amino acid permease [Rhodospirillales bacterium]|nr:MAG: amino acid permease [Rhodospirillales bacterium]